MTAEVIVILSNEILCKSRRVVEKKLLSFHFWTEEMDLYVLLQSDRKKSLNF